MFGSLGELRVNMMPYLVLRVRRSNIVEDSLLVSGVCGGCVGMIVRCALCLERIVSAGRRSLQIIAVAPSSQRNQSKYHT